MSGFCARTNTVLWPVLWLVVLFGAGCSEPRRESTAGSLTAALPIDFPFDLHTILLSPELAQPISAGVEAWASWTSAENRFPDLAARDDLEPAIQRPGTRLIAGDELYRRWHEDPANFLWLTTAIRYDHLLQRTKELDQILATPVLADTTTATGAFAYAVRHYRIGSRGRFYARAAGQGELPPLTRLILLRKTAMVLSHNGEHLAAVRQLLASLPEVREVGGPRLETRYWYSIALALKRADRLDDAVHAVAMGLHCAIKTDNAAFQGILRKQLASLLNARQEYDAALIQFEAVAEYGRRENLPWVILDATDKAAALCSSRGRPDLALRYDRKNLAHSLAVGDSLNAPRNMMNLADDFLQTGDLDSSLVYQNRAVAWETSNPHEQNQAGLPFLRAEYFCYVGDYDTADSLLALARERSGTSGLARDEAMLLLGLVDRGLEMSRIDMAHRSWQRLGELRPVLFDQRPDQNLLADFELATADLNLALGEFRPARAALDSAWLAITAEGRVSQKDHYHRTAGQLALMRGDLAAANREFKAKLDIALDAGHPGRIAESRQLLGRILLLEGKISAAEKLLVDPDQDPSFGGTFRTRLTNLQLQGRSRRLAGEPAAAREVLAKAVALSTPYSPADVMAGIHLELGRTLVALQRRDEAKVHYEMARAHLEQSNFTATEIVGYIDDTRRQLALALITWYLAANPDDHRQDDVMASLQVANQALLNVAMPWATSAATVQALASLAPDNDCVGLYFLGQDESFLWVGHAGRWRVQALPGRDRLRELVVPVVADLNQSRRAPDEESLAHLGDVLLGPLLPDWSPGATLTIIVDGFLGNIPWPALFLPASERSAAVERGPIVESPGLQKPAHAVVAEAAGPRTLLAVGYNGAVGQSDRLRNAEKEAEMVAAAWTVGAAEVLVGSAASWSAKITTRLQDFDVLHLATHARVREGWSAESSLMLADGDGVLPLTTQAIRDLSWAGELVFLSSCESGRSHLSGRGMMGLAGAFLGTGTKAVLASTGEVDDSAGIFFARKFYQHWLTGKSRAAALRAAQLEMIRTQPQWSHPYFWSRYRLIRAG